MITLARKSRTQRTPPWTAAIIEKLADAVFVVAEKNEINATEDKESWRALIVESSAVALRPPQATGLVS